MHLTLNQKTVGLNPTAPTRIFKSPPIHRTPLYRLKAAYCGMLRRCENRCGSEPAYANVKLKMTLAEFTAWALPKYEEFIAKFPGMSPSISRFGDTGDYEIGNIEIISTIENRLRQAAILLLRTDGTKMCVICRKVLTAEGNFTKNRTRPDGLQNHCRNCQRDLHSRGRGANR